MADGEPRYWAFLSYSHQDAGWANRLHRALERFATPARLVGAPTPAGPAPRRLQPIFRDRDELGAAADLSGRLVEALEGSAYLIVVCSPAAVQSRWVNEEIKRFRALHGEARILAVIVGGRPFASLEPDGWAEECFPEALRGDPETPEGLEPIAADLRPGRDGFRLAVLKLAAGMLGVGLDELVRRDARRRQRQLMLVTGGSLAASVVLASVALVAVGERNEAYAQRAQAEGLIEFMIGDLRDRLEPTGGLDALDAVGARALAYYAAQADRSLDAEELGRRARVLHMLGDIRDRRGDLAGALALFEEAGASTGELLARRPDDPQRIFDHAQSVYWIGYIAWRRGHDEVADQAFAEYQALANRLVAIDPKNEAWQDEVVYANSNLGTVLLQDGNAEAAHDAFQRALNVSQRLAAAAPSDRQRQMDLGQSYAWLADAEYLRGRLDAAAADRGAEAAVYGRLLAANPADNEASLALDVNRTALARMALTKGEAARALSGLQLAEGDLDRMMRAAPGDRSYQVKAAPTLLMLARMQLARGDLDAAAAGADRVAGMAAAALKQDPTAVAWAGEALGTARVLAMKIAAAREASSAGQAAALAAAPAEAERLQRLADTRPHNLALARVTAEAAMLAGDRVSLTGDASAARADWQAALERLNGAGRPGQPAGDASGVLLRQLGFRLQFGRPPTGDLNATAAKGRVPSPVDYRW